MKLIIPNNIFATLFYLSINSEIKPEVEVKEASLISSSLEEDQNAVGLIPSLDLIDNRDLYVSSKFGIGFESALSNSYLYFSKSNKGLNEIYLRGAITKNEVVFSKIVFQERYNIQPEILLDSNENINEENNYLISGTENWKNGNYLKGSSFCEQVSELIESPYLGFLFASKNKEAIIRFNNDTENMDKSIFMGLSENLEKIGLDKDINDFIMSEIDTVCFDLKQQETEGLSELLQIVYYHKILDDLFDVKFV